jgi:hypothetical protein
MQEAYELADRNDSEGYNAIKVMCGDVQRILQRQRTWKTLRSSTINKLFCEFYPEGIKDGGKSFAKAIEAKLKEKNT